MSSPATSRHRCCMCIWLGRTFSISKSVVPFEAWNSQSRRDIDATLHVDTTVLSFSKRHFLLSTTYTQQHTSCHIYDYSRLYNDTWTWYTFDTMSDDAVDNGQIIRLPMWLESFCIYGSWKGMGDGREWEGGNYIENGCGYVLCND